MTTLVLELSGAQQAWGSRSRFTNRATELAPTKSGVIGLIAAALGLDRDAPLDRFAGLRFGVRIDQPGKLERDFQTTRSLDGTTSFPLSERHYLADAVFVAALEGPADELTEYAEAINRPHYPLYLGRRAFPPDRPLRATIADKTLEQTLETQPWRARPHHRRRVPTPSVKLQVVRDAGPDDVVDHSRTDVPVSFDPRRRLYASRDVVVTSVKVDHPDPPRRREPQNGKSERTSGQRSDALLGIPTDHDPETLLADEEV